jgi:GNAT superfamily N-acetyltransferase
MSRYRRPTDKIELPYDSVSFYFAKFEDRTDTVVIDRKGTPCGLPMFGYYLDGKCVGILIIDYQDMFEKFWRVDAVFVLEQHRRKGIATALFFAAKAHLGELRHARPLDRTADGKAWIESLPEKSTV